jgi:hypothetical protein
MTRRMVIPFVRKSRVIYAHLQMIDGEDDSTSNKGWERLNSQDLKTHFSLHNE